MIPRERLAHLAARIHSLGARPLYELFCELDAGQPLHARLEAYARLAGYGDFIRSMGGDKLPRPQVVVGRRP